VQFTGKGDACLKTAHNFTSQNKIKMKQIITTILLALLLKGSVAQNKVSISFNNDYADVYHLSLIIYPPDGKNQTRVSDLQPGTTKTYEWPTGTEIFIADWQQESFAMQGNDIKATGIKPYMVLQNSDDKKVIQLSGIWVQRNIKAPKPQANDALGTWVIDLRPTPESAPYRKDFIFTKIEGNTFTGEFYGYPFSGGFINTSWDKLYFAFTTSDQSSTYYHSGYVEGNTVHGLTLNEKRGFVMPWKGQRKP
jgi:hypothetical protein